MPVNFLFNNAAMGDYIGYTAAILWIAENAPWIAGRVYVDRFMVLFVRHFLDRYPHWKVIEAGEISVDPTVCIIGADLTVDGGKQFQQLLNATGASIMHLAFAYYAAMTPPPEGVTYPQLTQDKAKLPKALRGKEGQYVVFTPGATTTSRRLTGRHLNPVIAHVRSLGLLPVFLGKSQMTAEHGATFADDILYEEGLDLRNQTTMLEAACVMEHSLVTTGLDNGLLHLAGCTPGNLIFGYNIASPEHRRPWRGQYDSRTVDIVLSPEELPCTLCQSRMKMLLAHSFHQCLYGDLRCVDLLFSDEGKRWKDAISRFI